MIWKVKTESGDIELTDFEIINLLSSKIIEKERPDMENLSQSFTRYLQHNDALSDISLTQLVSMALELGYFYRTFKDQNQVEIIEVNSEADTNQSELKPTS